eukprot:UN28052
MARKSKKKSLKGVKSLQEPLIDEINRRKLINETYKPTCWENNSHIFFIILAVLFIGVSYLFYKNLLIIRSGERLKEKPQLNLEFDTCQENVRNLWLNDEFEAFGYHVFCFKPQLTNESTYKFLAHIWLDGLEKYYFNLTFEVHNYIEFRQYIEFNLNFSHTDEYTSSNPDVLSWIFTNVNGTPITELSKISEQKPYFIFEGGSWVWPGVRKGFKRYISENDKTYEMETVSCDPAIFVIRKFLTRAECGLLIELGQTSLFTDSEIAHTKFTMGDSSEIWRTSKTSWMPDDLKNENPEIIRIDERLSLFTRLPTSHQEPTQLLKYEKNERYDFHYDFFHHDLYKEDTMESHNTRGNTNRLATFIWYLNT